MSIIDAPPPTALAVSIHETWLGTALLARDEHGIRALLPGKDEAVVSKELRASFPKCTVGPDFEPPELVDFAHPLPPAVVIAPVGTPFQLDVWRALSEIPRGETRTYAEIARNLGMSAGARAVGSACAANAIAVLIPCHRAVRAGGGISGYRWGIRRKMRLLEREAMERMELGLRI